VFVVLFKLNLIGWTLFGWVVAGHDGAYHFQWLQDQLKQNQSPKAQNINAYIDWWTMRGLELDTVLPLGIGALAFGMVCRMALLRWKRGWIVGVVLASLVMAALTLGVWIRGWDDDTIDVAPIIRMFVWLMGYIFLVVLLGASIVWPIWVLIVRAFLPRRLSDRLLDWQCSLSERDAAAVARNP